MTKFYGETKTETDAGEMLQCRQIVLEIMNFGVSQGQILQVIKLLALELESREQMLAINECIADLTGDAVTEGDSLKSLITE